MLCVKVLYRFFLLISEILYGYFLALPYIARAQILNVSPNDSRYKA